MNHESMSEQLAEQTARLRAILDSTVDGIITIDEKGTIETFNKACQKIFGYTAEEVIGQNIKVLMPEPYHSEHDGYLQKYKNSGEKKIIGIGREVSGKRKDGSLFFLDLSVSEVAFSGKKMFSGIIRDITERKLAEEHLEQTIRHLADQKGRLQAVLDGTVDGIITINEMGMIQSFNKACERIFGYRSDEVIGKNIKILMPEPYQSEHDSYLQRYRSTGEKKIIGIGREVSGKRKDGTLFPVDLSVSEVSLNDRRLFSGIIRDITERKTAEDKIQRIVEDLRLSNRELETFAYVASHDLKSPLRAIDNLTKWLEEDLASRLDEGSKDKMQKLKGRVLRMEHLLDDLLEYSRAGAKFEASEPMPIKDIIQETKDFLNMPEGFEVLAEDDLKDILVPRMPIQQIFNNLISNAIKHHHKKNGIVRVAGADKNYFYEFKVIDDGPGIPKQYHEKIFEMFQTLKPRDEVEGSGMGLAIVKKILYRFSGRIYVDSEEGQGTTFTFTWPKNQKGEALHEREYREHITS